MKKFCYILAIDILRESWGVLFQGLGVQKTPTRPDGLDCIYVQRNDIWDSGYGLGGRLKIYLVCCSPHGRDNNKQLAALSGYP